MKKFISFVGASMLPFVAFAQTYGTSTNTGLSTLISDFGTVLSKLFPIAVAIAVLAFFYEVIMFIINKDKDVDKAKTFKNGILWSLLALALIFTFFGLIKVIANTLGIGGTVGAGIGTTDIPTVQL